MAGFGHRQMLNKTNEKADFKSVKKLFLYIKPYLPSIIIALVLAVIGAITTIVGPEKISDLMNIITNGLTTPNGVDMTKFVEIAVMLICLYLAGAVANYVQQFLMAGVTQKTSKRLRTDINKKINNLPLKYFDTTTRGDILSRVTNDVDTISQTFGSTIANLVNAITLFFGVLIMMFTVNWILALITIGTSILGFVLMSIILRKSQKYFQLRQQNLGEMNGHIEEIYTNHNVVKSYNAEDKSKEKFKGINKKLFTNNWKSQALSGLMPPIMNFAGNLSYATIFIVGVALILNGSTAITFGTIISFTIYARLFSQPLSTIAQSMNSLQQTAAASKRVFDLLDEEELIEYNLEYNFEFKLGKYSKSNIVFNEYIYYLSLFKEEFKHKITLDLSNGALVNIANKLFNNDDNITLINKDYNGININDCVGSLYIKDIDIKESKYLFSFDGDGDRILFKDNNNIYNGDVIVYLLAIYYKLDKVVLTDNVNPGLLKAFKKRKIKVCLSSVGDKNVYNTMIKENILLGGESSGHIINLKYMTSGDGLLNFLIINKILNEIDINKYLKDIKYYPEINLNLDSNYNLEKLNEIKEKYLEKAKINKY